MAAAVDEALAPATGSGSPSATCADSVARLTVTVATPGTAAMAFSTRPTQLAQVMPRTSNRKLGLPSTGAGEGAGAGAGAGSGAGASAGAGVRSGADGAGADGAGGDGAGADGAGGDGAGGATAGADSAGAAGRPAASRASGSRARPFTKRAGSRANSARCALEKK